MQLLNAFPRQPFLGLALAATTGILVAEFIPEHSLLPIAAVAILAVTAGWTRHSLAVYALVATCFFFVHSLSTTDSPGLSLARELGEKPRPITVLGTVASEPKISPNGSASFVLQAESIELDGLTRRSRVKFFARWRQAVQYGDKIKLFGTAERPNGPRNPGEFDMPAYLGRQDIRRELIVRYRENGVILDHTGGNPILRMAHQSRDWMQAILSRDLTDSPEVTGAISGMVLGLRHQTADDIEEPFQRTGTLHLFAVAGLHVGIVARLFWIVAATVRLPRKWATALIIPALLFYAAVTGLHTSSIRAALMSAVLLAGFLVERKVFALNSLAAAATLILCWNTNELFSVGFQLSFLVVAAIVLFAEPTYQFLQRRLAPDPFLPRSLFGTRRRLVNHSLSWLARAGSVSFAAWIGSLPLMLWHYYLVTPISLLANLIVVPIAFFVLAGGLLSVAAAPLSPWLSVAFNNANWFLTKAILGAVHFFAQIPAGYSYIEHPHWSAPAQLEINALDLKSGGAIHVRTASGDWLFDAGSLRDYARVVEPYLRSRGVNRLEGLILTHGDAGHIGGASDALLDFHPHRLIDTTLPNRSVVHRRLIEELGRNGNSRRLCAAGDEVDLSPDVRARILFPPIGFAGTKADDRALVVQLLVSGKPLALIMSDSGLATENYLLRNGCDLRSNLILKGQHHSGISGSEAFLDCVQPQAIVATSREFPEYERIKDDWAELVRTRGIKLFRQDETGAVRIVVYRDRWEAKAYLTSETFRSTSR